MKLTGNNPLFLEVAEHYERLLRLKVYKEGDYLPSVREVALENKINPNTVVHAFSILVDKGLITSIPKKGYIVNRIEDNKTSTNESKINDITLELIKLNKFYSLEEIEIALNKLKENK